MLIPDRPIFVSPLPSLVSGVDFLGLAAVNERMVARALPGISNVTRYMRVYSVMAWMAWRFSEHLKDANGPRGKGLTEAEIRRRFKAFREKVEFLFTLGNESYTNMAGASRRAYLPEGEAAFDVDFKAFGDVAVSWLDAAQYGPSLGVDNGLGLIKRTPGRSYAPTPIGVELAVALDKSLAKSAYYDSICDVHSSSVTRAMIEELASHWEARSSTSAERRHFSAAFFQVDGDEEGKRNPNANRAAMIRLVLRAVEAIGEAATVVEVREAIARGITVSGKVLDLASSELTQAVWAVLQIRQLQRLAQEAMLRWVEKSLLEPSEEPYGRTPRALADRATTLAAKFLDLSADTPLRSLCARIEAKVDGRDYYVAGLTVDEIDIFRLRERLIALAANTDDMTLIPGHAVHALLVCAGHARSLLDSERHARWLDTGDRSRISLRTLVNLVESYRDQPLRAFVHVLIETGVIGQHFNVTATKLEAGKNKFRFITVEEGLRPLIRPDQVTGLFVTGDRLENAMQLMADCGLLKWDGERFYAV